MPDMIGTPVGAMIQPPDPMQGVRTLSGIIGIQQQKQALQTGQYQQATAQAQSQVAQRNNSQQQALATFTQNAMKDPAYKLPDGSADVQKFQQGAMSVAPNQQETIGQATSNFKEGIEARKAALGLSNEQNAVVVNGLKGIAGLGPKATPTDWLNFKEQVEANNPDPGLRRALDNATLGLNRGDIATGAAALAKTLGGIAPAATNLQTAQGVQGANVEPFTGAINTAGSAVMNAPPPGVASAPSGALVRTGAGGIGGGAGGGGRTTPPNRNAAPTGPTPIGRVNGRPRTAQDDAPPPNAPTSIQSQFGTSAKAANEQVGMARAADDQYGTNMSIAHTIRNLSSSTNSGPGTQTWNKWIGTLTSPSGGIEKVSNYQTLGSFLDRQAASLRQQQGLPDTNLGTATAQQIGGTTEFQPATIQAKNNLNEALTEGVHLFRQGLDRVEGFTGNASPQAVQQFKSLWAANFDPVAQEYKLAMKRGDKETASKIISQYSPQQRAELAQKGRNLDLLSQGLMPR